MRMLLLLLVGAWLSAEEPSTRSYPIPGTGLAVAAPVTWNPARNRGGAALVLRGPAPATATDPAQGERERGTLAVTVQALPVPETTAIFAAHCRTDLERFATGLVVEEQADTVIGARTWVRLRYRMEVGQFTFLQELLATVIDGQGVCVTCSCVASAFAQWRPDFAALVASLGHSSLEIK
jgi:hypothetical protein